MSMEKTEACEEMCGKHGVAAYMGKNGVWKKQASITCSSERCIMQNLLSPVTSMEKTVAPSFASIAARGRPTTSEHTESIRSQMGKRRVNAGATYGEKRLFAYLGAIVHGDALPLEL